MKQFLLFFFSLVMVSTVFAHVEPPRTLKEIEVKEKQRRDVWNRSIKSQKGMIIKDGQEQEGALVQQINYDELGRMVEILGFDNGTTIFQENFRFDEQNNLIEDVENFITDQSSEKATYAYDPQGRIQKERHDENNQLDAAGDYVWNEEHKTIEIVYRGANNERLSSLIYFYDGSIDKGNLREIHQFNSEGVFTTKAEYTYDDSGRHITKTVSKLLEKVSYTFHYQYDAFDQLTYVKKVDPEGHILSEVYNEFNCSSLLIKTTELDGSGQVLNEILFKYDFY